jgi:hypothetical protein
VNGGTFLRDHDDVVLSLAGGDFQPRHLTLFDMGFDAGLERGLQFEIGEPIGRPSREQLNAFPVALEEHELKSRHLSAAIVHVRYPIAIF